MHGLFVILISLPFCTPKFHNSMGSSSLRRVGGACRCCDRRSGFWAWTMAGLLALRYTWMDGRTQYYDHCYTYLEISNIGVDGACSPSYKRSQRIALSRLFPLIIHTTTTSTVLVSIPLEFTLQIAQQPQGLVKVIAATEWWRPCCYSYIGI